MKCNRALGLAICGVLLLGLTPRASAQESRIAVIDMTKLMKGYDKSKQAEAELQKRAAVIQTDQDKMREKLNELNRQYRAALEDSKETALSEAAREKKNELAVAKLTELKQYETSVRQEVLEADKALKAQSRRMQDDIIAELRAEVTKYASNNGYDMVIDTITVVYTNDKIVDITENVAAQLEDKK